MSSSPAVADGSVYVGSNDHKIYCFRDNHPPDTPDLSGPTEGVVEVEYIFSTSTTDPEGDQIFYLFDWDDETDSSWISSSSATHIWSDEGVYEVRVKAKDIHGAKSDWSPVLFVTVNERPAEEILTITADSAVIENDDFQIMVTAANIPVEDVQVEFNDQTKYTNTEGMVTFTAPLVDQDTHYYITASFEDYVSATVTVSVLDQEEPEVDKGWIYGVVSNTSGSLLEDVSVCVVIAQDAGTTSQCVFTDEQGRYHIFVQTGTHSVVASEQGYETVSYTHLRAHET